jgi:hypothetical protein
VLYCETLYAVDCRLDFCGDELLKALSKDEDDTPSKEPRQVGKLAADALFPAKAEEEQKVGLMWVVLLQLHIQTQTQTHTCTHTHARAHIAVKVSETTQEVKQVGKINADAIFSSKDGEDKVEEVKREVGKLQVPPPPPPRFT